MSTEEFVDVSVRRLSPLVFNTLLSFFLQRTVLISRNSLTSSDDLFEKLKLGLRSVGKMRLCCRAWKTFIDEDYGFLVAIKNALILHMKAAELKRQESSYFPIVEKLPLGELKTAAYSGGKMTARLVGVTASLVLDLTLMPLRITSSAMSAMFSSPPQPLSSPQSNEAVNTATSTEPPSDPSSSASWMPLTISFFSTPEEAIKTTIAAPSAVAETAKAAAYLTVSLGGTAADVLLLPVRTVTNYISNSAAQSRLNQRREEIQNSVEEAKRMKKKRPSHLPKEVKAKIIAAHYPYFSSLLLWDKLQPTIYFGIDKAVSKTTSQLLPPILYTYKAAITEVMENPKSTRQASRVYLIQIERRCTQHSSVSSPPPIIRYTQRTYTHFEGLYNTLCTRYPDIKKKIHFPFKANFRTVVVSVISAESVVQERTEAFQKMLNYITNDILNVSYSIDVDILEFFYGTSRSGSQYNALLADDTDEELEH